jgi:predicted TIM-barrel fold metal-dependent hydrolase
MNSAKQKLAAGKLALCMGLRQARTPDIAMIAAECGFDALYADMEHTLGGRRHPRRSRTAARPGAVGRALHHRRQRHELPRRGRAQGRGNPERTGLKENASEENLVPAFCAPPLACDAHFHVFGPLEKYPARDPKLRYKMPLAPLADFLALARKLGFERFVFVQPSAYMRDNGCMLEAMQEMGPRCRGIVDFLLPGRLTTEMMPVWAKLKVDYTLAHMGMYLAKDGPKQPGFLKLLDLLRNGSGRCWIKFTGTYRMSQAPGFSDVAPMARALIETAPDRIIWGSDYPHLSFADKVGSIELYNLLGQWAPDEATRKKIFTDNPAKLFGFAAP